MYLRNKILVLSLISLIVFGSVPISAGTSSQLAEQPEMKVQEKALAKWTVLTYMDGDNDLGYKYNAHIADKQEMELVGSTSEVNILIEFDSHPSVTDSAYRASARYYVKSGYSEQILVEEQDMTDPRTLVESIRWAMSDYPSEKFCLVLWNHGIGWIGMNRDDTTGEDYYELELEQLKEALYIIKQETGKKIDVILFDMCLMGMLEVAYQLDGLADYIVFSEDKIPVDSRKYQDTLADLVANSTWTAERLAQEWVYDYVGSGGMITQSAVNMSRLPSLIEAMKNFAYLLKENIDTYSTAINNAINSVKDYSVDLPSLGSSDGNVYADLYDFASKLKAQSVPLELKNACDAVMTNVSSTVIAKKGGTGDNGLSIFLPPKSWGGGTAGYRYASLFLAMYDTYLKDKHNEVAIDFGHSELSNIQWAPFLRANLAPSAYTHDFTIQVHWGWGLGSWRNTIRAPWYARVNSTTYVDAFIRNWGKVSETNVPVKLYFQGSAVETKYISLGQKEVAYLSFNWTTPSQPGSYQVRIQAELAGDEKPANDGANVTIKVTDKKVFVVDDDGGASYEKYYTDALNASGIGYEYWNVKQTEGTINELWDRTAYGTPSHADTLKAFDVVIWFTGNYDVRFKGRDIRAQEAYLEQGGSLFVADANLEDMQWCTYYYRDKLHTEYVNDSSGVTTLTGVANDPIGDGLSLTISTGDAVAQAEPSVIEPRNTSVANWTKASAQRVFTWSAGTYAGKGGVIRVEGTTYRAIYFGFGFEGIDGAAIRATTMNRTVTWLLGWKVSTVTLNLEKGWNFINLALDISHTAESLAQNITNCTQVARWNLSSEKFEIYVKGSGINNFAIEKGIGYLVYVTESTVATFCGSKITSLTLELKKGWNSIGWFKEAVTVGELALQIGNCTAVSYWDSSSGRFVAHLVGTLISDFELIKGKGYLVYVTQTTLWNC